MTEESDHHGAGGRAFCRGAACCAAFPLKPGNRRNVGA